MRALYWDGQELSFKTSYPRPTPTSKIEDRGSKIVGATGSRPASENQSTVVKVHASGLELAMSAVRPRGTLVLKSTIASNHQVSLGADRHQRNQRRRFPLRPIF
jgi:hypothetical protein